MDFRGLEVLECDVLLEDGSTVRHTEMWAICFDGEYAVSTLGRIWSFCSGRLVGSKDKRSGYVLCRVGGMKYAHEVIMRVWGVPKPTDEHEIDHCDNVRWSNSVFNLQWLTHRENVRKSFEQGRVVVRGKRHYNTGKKASPETRKKMSETRKLVWSEWRAKHGFIPDLSVRKQGKVPVVRVKRSVEERKEAMSRIRSWDV